MIGPSRIRRVLRVLRRVQLGHDVDAVLHDEEIARAAAAGLTRREYLGPYLCAPWYAPRLEHFPLSAEPLPADGPTTPGATASPVEDVGPQTSTRDNDEGLGMEAEEIFGPGTTIARCILGETPTYGDLAEDTSWWIAARVHPDTARRFEAVIASHPMITSAQADARITAAMETFTQHTRPTT
ncbi:hypothetical protein BH11ACT6_BH11ACT6_34510 [soil metagenome]